MHYITESLLVGNLADARRPPASVTAILFVGDAAPAAPAGVAWAAVPLQEYREADPTDVQRGVEWLEHRPEGSRVMVCCRAGMGRSVSLAIAYLCCVKDMAYDEALALVKQRRPGATPLPKLQETIEQVRQLRGAGGRSSQGAATEPPSAPHPSHRS